MVTPMTLDAHRLPHYAIDDEFSAPAADNENLLLLAGCALTPLLN